MKNTLHVLSILFISFSRLTGTNPVDYVNPFICTEGDHGQWHPSALVPFGLVKLGPDTYPSSLTGDGDWAHSGYNYSDSQFRGFSHFHKGSSGGTRIGDRAGFLSIMPFSDEPVDSFYRNPVTEIDKKSEQAQPGFYQVYLNHSRILAELTTTPHVGFHRYTFANGKPVQIFIYEGNRSRSHHFSCRITDAHTIEGIQHTGRGIFHFIMQFNSRILNTSVWDGEQIQVGQVLAQQKNGGLICNFGDLNGESLQVKVGVSLTSIEAARKNLRAECPHWNFALIQEQALTLWNEKLGCIQVEGDAEYKTIFYTALYHACFLPVTLTDVDGTYPGLDKQTHVANGYVHYGDYAFWDSFRTKYPLYSLFQPDIYRDIVKSLRDIYEQADNWLPFPDSDHAAHGSLFLAQGKNGYQVYSTCRHEHKLMVIADAFFKNLLDIDINSVYPYLRREALIQMPTKYDTIGFIPARPDQTGEYCWDNWCVAQIAKRIGRLEDDEYFMKRSHYWKNTWDSSLRFFRARAADGSWLDFPDNPTVNREKYTYEGSKWHWRWNALHDVPSMIASMGDPGNFLKELEYFFENDLYTAGNQIDLHAPYLFNDVGAPWLTQKWVHRILADSMVQRYGTHGFFEKPIFDRIYKATPDGYLEEMDDDYGCMAAWYVLSAIGLYQICPGQPIYQLTGPLFKKIIIKLNNSIYPGNEFIIEAPAVSAKNYYIQSIKYYDVTGRFIKDWNQTWISHEDLVKGGKFVFDMGPNLNKNWGKAK